jgi:hypothetical protein
MRLRYAGTCRLCGERLDAGVEAIYERATRSVKCLRCDVEPMFLSPGVIGVAGGSAWREYERRTAIRDARLAENPRLGRLVATLTDVPQSTRAWRIGAVGEARVAAVIDPLASDNVAVLHDRRIPGARANIDHIVVTRRRIWVIDAKRYAGRRPVLRRTRPRHGPMIETLVVGGRNCTQRVDSVLWQLEVIQAVTGPVPVVGALCFVDAKWPLFGGSFTTRGVHVLWPKRLAKMIRREKRGAVDVAGVRELLAVRLPAA